MTLVSKARRADSWVDRRTVVAETLSGRAHLGVMADVTALVTRTTRERRHGDRDGERLNV